MSHYAKLQQYHKSIRKQELHSIFSQKRIKLLECLNPAPLEQQIDLQNMNADTLQYLARLCQTEQGIEKIYDMRIEHMLEKYLGQQYLNSNEQRFTSLILCNLYIIARPAPPPYELTRDIIRLLQVANMDVVSNIITLIFNIANDHPQWKVKVVTEYHICTLLCEQLQREGCNRLQIINVLRTTLKIIQGIDPPHSSFLKLYPILVNFLNNPSSNDHQIIGHAYFCFYNLSLRYSGEAVGYIINENLLNRFLRITPLLKEAKFLKATLHILQIMIFRLSSSDIRSLVLPFIEKIMIGGYKGGNRIIKNATYEVIIKILEQAKITSVELMSINIGHTLLDDFAHEEDAQVLHSLVYLFSIVIMNIELCSFTDELERLFERVEMICPQEIETIGFIKETQMKAKRRAALLL